MFTKFSAAMRMKNAMQVVSHVDFERMTEELESRPGFPPIPSKERAGFVNGLRNGSQSSMMTNFADLGWVQYRIARIKALSRDDALVYMAQTADDGRIDRMRWWVHRGSGGVWRIYDFEELLFGARASDLMTAQAIGVLTPVPPPWTRLTSELGRAI